jgi:hypothetical protein
MRRFAVAIGFVLVAVALSGRSKRELSLSYKSPDAGYLIASIGAEKTTHVYTTYFVDVRKTDRSKDDQLTYNRDIASIDSTVLAYDDSDETGEVNVVSLPPGNYEINCAGFYQNMGMSESTWACEKDFSVPFTIETGKATYIGNFQGITVRGKNIFGIRVEAGGYYVVRNKAERDLPLAKRMGAPYQDVRVAVPDPHQAHSALLQTERLAGTE